MIIADRLLSAAAAFGSGVIAYRTVPVVWAVHPWDASLVCLMLGSFDLRMLAEALTGRAA